MSASPLICKMCGAKYIASDDFENLICQECKTKSVFNAHLQGEGKTTELEKRIKHLEEQICGAREVVEKISIALMDTVKLLQETRMDLKKAESKIAWMERKMHDFIQGEEVFNNHIVDERKDDQVIE